MIVVDASAVLEVLLRGTRAERVEHVMFDADEPLAAPHLLDLEVVQVLRRLASRRTIDPVRASQALDDYEALPILRYDHLPLLRPVWSLRANATAYDAAYLVLAQALPARLLTCDTKLRSVPGHAAAVVCID